MINILVDDQTDGGILSSCGFQEHMLGGQWNCILVLIACYGQTDRQQDTQIFDGF